MYTCMAWRVVVFKCNMGINLDKLTISSTLWYICHTARAYISMYFVGRTHKCIYYCGLNIRMEILYGVHMSGDIVRCTYVWRYCTVYICLEISVTHADIHRFSQYGYTLTLFIGAYTSIFPLIDLNIVRFMWGYTSYELHENANKCDYVPIICLRVTVRTTESTLEHTRDMEWIWVYIPQHLYVFASCGFFSRISETTEFLCGRV